MYLLHLGMYGVPARTGKLKNVNKFDAEFFGIHSKLANSMDVQLRILLEVTHEAIVDAGKIIKNKTIKCVI